MRNSILEIIIFSLIFLLVLGVLVIGLIQPYFEMKAFNKFSGTKVTYWDALVSDLRIITDKKN